MKFAPIPLNQAEGKILGHNIAGLDGNRVLRKGKPLSGEDVAVLHALGRKMVYVAELEAGDVDENAAALRVAQAVMGEGLRLSGPATGRVNLLTLGLGVLRVDETRLAQLNGCEGVTLATLTNHTAVGGHTGRKLTATIKILPFALPESTVQAAEAIAQAGPLLSVTPLLPQFVALLFSGSASAKERVLAGFEPPLRHRLNQLGAVISHMEFVALEDEEGEAALAGLLRHYAPQVQLIILAGETAVMDRYDITPRAVERAGGQIICFGAPVDPGNLLMLAQIGKVPVLGAPGCVRSLKLNIVDWVLPRLLAGDTLTKQDIFALGHGGLLEEIAERPFPRQFQDPKE